MDQYFETQPIPEAPHDQVAAYLQKYAALQFPGFVVRSDQTPDDALHAVETALGPDFAYEEEIDFGGGPGFGWHADYKAVSDKPHIETSVHQTTHGAVMVELLATKPTLWSNDGYPNRNLMSMLPDRWLDTDLTAPVVYTGKLAVGDVVVFALGGPSPTLHRFTSLERPRLSIVRTIDIPRQSSGL